MTAARRIFVPCATLPNEAFPVAELPPDSSSNLLRRYRVLTVPTVLLLDKTGKEIGRFEGEDATTVKAVRTRLAALAGAN